MLNKVRSQHIYLDYNACAPLRPCAKSAMVQALALSGNPASTHTIGQCARRSLEESRSRLSNLLHITPEELVFTSGGTEANFLALHGTLPHVRSIVALTGGHASIQKPIQAIKHIPVHFLRPTQNGNLDKDQLRELLPTLRTPFLCTVPWAHHETGTLEDIAHLSELVRTHGGFLHVDTCQALGKVPLDLSLVHMASFSSQKVGGPTGIGAFYIDSTVPFTSPIQGGTQERGLRAGTPSIALAAGFAAAVEEAVHTLPKESTRLKGLQDTLEKSIQETSPHTVVFGQRASRLPGTTFLTMPHTPAETQVMTFDLEGIAVSAGAACSSGTGTVSSLLLSMGVVHDIAATALRVSFGWQTTSADIDTFVEAWSSLYTRLHSETQQPTLGDAYAEQSPHLS